MVQQMQLTALLGQASQEGMFLFYLAVLVLFAVTFWMLGRRAPHPGSAQG